jgi:hypothetical protein
MIHQSSAVLCFNMPNRLTSLAATNILASTKVVVVTVKTALPRELCPPMEDIGEFFPRIPQLIWYNGYQVMVDGDCKLPSVLKMRILGVPRRRLRGRPTSRKREKIVSRRQSTLNQFNPCGGPTNTKGPAQVGVQVSSQFDFVRCKPFPPLRNDRMQLLSRTPSSRAWDPVPDSGGTDEVSFAGPVQA